MKERRGCRGQREFGGQLRDGRTCLKRENGFIIELSKTFLLFLLELKFLFLEFASFISRECVCCFAKKLVQKCYVRKNEFSSIQGRNNI